MCAAVFRLRLCLPLSFHLRLCVRSEFRFWESNDSGDLEAESERTRQAEHRNPTYGTRHTAPPCWVWDSLATCASSVRPPSARRTPVYDAQHPYVIALDPPPSIPYNDLYFFKKKIVHTVQKEVP